LTDAPFVFVRHGFCHGFDHFGMFTKERSRVNASEQEPWSREVD
jgi:hypothetical protein